MSEDQLRPDDPCWPQIEATTLADRVYHVIRSRILQRELPPGTFIREQEVSRATGVSRTPVREALNRLASQDFLERVPHRGFRVPDLPWETLLEIYPIVTSLEVLAGSIAFENLGLADLAKLRSINDRLAKEAAANSDSKRLAELNNAFHKIFSERSGNQRLSDLLDHLRSQLVLLDGWYYSDPEHVSESIREHAAIIDAIQDRDFDRALVLLKQNYSRGRQSLEDEVGRQAGHVAV